MVTTLPDGTVVRVVASGPSADFYAGWLRGYDLSGPVTQAVIVEAEKALAVARDILTRLQQEAPSAAVVSASGASGATSSAAESSLITSTSAELVSSSDQAEGFYTPPADACGSAGATLLQSASEQAQAPEAAAPSAAASDEGQVPRPPQRLRPDKDPWYSEDRSSWCFPVGPLVREPPAEILELADCLEGLRSLTHRGGFVSGRERVFTAWRLGLADRECAVHFYHPNRRVQTLVFVAQLQDQAILRDPLLGHSSAHCRERLRAVQGAHTPHG